MTVGTYELDPVPLADFPDVLLHGPAEGVVGDQEVPAFGLGVGLHEVVNYRLGRRVGAGGPLERVAVAARSRDVLGTAAEVVEGLLPLGDLRNRQGDARGPGANDVFHAVGVDGLLGPPCGAARLRLVVARDVLDRLALDPYSPLVEWHLYAAIQDR